MNTWKTAVVRRLEATTPLYDVGIAPGVRTCEGSQRPPEEAASSVCAGGWAR